MPATKEEVRARAGDIHDRDRTMKELTRPIPAFGSDVVRKRSSRLVYKVPFSYVNGGVAICSQRSCQRLLLEVEVGTDLVRSGSTR